jgi:D-arabinose 1-dehydrogenase-like Zn-dependent alcohol dehydrogenase
MDLLRRHGLFVLVAQPARIELGYADFIFKDVTLVGSLHGNEKDLAELVRLVAKHGIKSDVVGYPMDRHEEMVRSVHEEGRKGKVVMTF